MSGEEWRPVEAWPYEVSNLGRVRRSSTGRILRPIPHSKGYRVVNLSHEGRRRQVYVHELVCVAWHGPRPAGMQVDHVDTVRDHNRASNLRWLPAVDNGTRYHQWYAERNGLEASEWTEDDEAELAETLRAFGQA